MLTLTRKLNQSIIIGDDVVPTIVDIGSNAVKIGVEATVEVPVHRTEVAEELKRIEDGRRHFWGD